MAASRTLRHGSSTRRGTSVTIGGTLYFTARDDTHGRELWKSDGTAAGTVLTKDIYPGRGSSGVNELTDVAGMVFFRADDGVHGQQLWRTDGTEAGTIMLSTFVGGPSQGSYPHDLTASGSVVYFFEPDTSGADDEELWKSDGTQVGTVLVKDLWPSGSGVWVWVDPPIDVSGTLYFGAQEPGGDGELWRSDGTTLGTMILARFHQTIAFNYPYLVGAVEGTVLFVVDDGQHGGELWRSDGTQAGTTLVRDIDPGPYGSMPVGSGAGTEIGPFYLHGYVVGDILLFDAYNASLGSELWRSDGTTAGTKLVRDIFPGPGNSSPVIDSYGDFPMMAEAGGALYFVARTHPHAWRLWKSDGTDVGTVLLSDPMRADVWSQVVAASGTTFLTVRLRSGETQLWKTDGTPAGTVVVKDLGRKGWIGPPSAVGSYLLFAGSDGFHGSELWRSDGTEMGTVVVKNIEPVNAFSPFGSGFLVVGTSAFFGARDVAYGSELWRSDGSALGTIMVTDINPGPASSKPSWPLFVPT